MEEHHQVTDRRNLAWEGKPWPQAMITKKKPEEPHWDFKGLKQDKILTYSLLHTHPQLIQNRRSQPTLKIHAKNINKVLIPNPSPMTTAWILWGKYLKSNLFQILSSFSGLFLCWFSKLYVPSVYWVIHYLELSMQKSEERAFQEETRANAKTLTWEIGT